MKIWKYLTGLTAGMALLGAVEAEPYTRKELNIPENGTCLEEGVDWNQNLYIKHWDIDGDGKYDMETVYRIYGASESGKEIPNFIISKNPFGLWYDRNGNSKADADEIYISIDLDENWKLQNEKEI